MRRIIEENFWSLFLCFEATALCVAVFAQMLGEYLG